MRKKLLLGVVGIILLLFSGCLTEMVPGVIIGGKYVSNNSSDADTLIFTDDRDWGSNQNIFYATEYMEFTQQTAEFYGTYKIVDTELVLAYEGFGIIRRFEISNNSRTLIEKDDNRMRFEWVINSAPRQE